MARQFKPGDKVTWGGSDRVYEVWSKHRRPGYLWLTHEGRTIEARAKNCTLVQAAATRIPAPATVTPLQAPAAKRAPKVTAEERSRIEAAIKLDAVEHGGRVDPNRVRAFLTGPDGALTVPPQALSGAYSSLAARGVIASLGFVGVNDDTRSGNAGKPQRHWEWTGVLPGVVA